MYPLSISRFFYYQSVKNSLFAQFPYYKAYFEKPLLITFDGQSEKEQRKYNKVLRFQVKL